MTVFEIWILTYEQSCSQIEVCVSLKYESRELEPV